MLRSYIIRFMAKVNEQTLQKGEIWEVTEGGKVLVLSDPYNHLPSGLRIVEVRRCRDDGETFGYRMWLQPADGSKGYGRDFFPQTPTTRVREAPRGRAALTRKRRNLKV